MCGISGIFTKHITEQHQKILDAIITSQIPRGPDYQESVKIIGKSAELLLGHNRLSIVDLSDKANQPMWDTTGRYCIVFNGEIYNYLEIREELQKLNLEFTSVSDTEVILNAFSCWGVNAITKFRGPFAFAVYDNKTEDLWLCRDRFGIRPLYYIERNGTLYFASTLTILAKQLNVKPNFNYIAQGLHYLIYEDGSHASSYENIHSLPAGSYARIKITQSGALNFSIHPYYNLADQVQEKIFQFSNVEPKELLVLLSDELKKSVNIRLRTDVPLAISLSSGLDSSSIASLVSQQYSNLRGFSFGEPTNKKTEGPLVAHCANYLNIPIEYVWPTSQQMIEGLFQTIEIQEAPFSTFSVVAQYLLYQQVKKSGIKVLLGGQGGDEVFMGYRKFMIFWIKQLLQHKSYKKALQTILAAFPMLLAELPSIGQYWRHSKRYLNKNINQKSSLILPSINQLSLNNIEQPLWKRQLQDILQFSLPTLLRYEDRNAMGNSVESRLPFMDHEVVELGLALPISLKLKKGYGKWIIRNMMKDQIPNAIRLARFKRGFDIPLAGLLKSGLGSLIRSHLKQNESQLNDFLHQKNRIDVLYSDQQLLQRREAMSEIFTLLWLNKALS